MGKGYNNYMCKKPFHPGSKANIKRAWMAEQKTENDKRKQDELKTQYEKEQDLYNNRALISSESKDKLELNFMYEAPPGAKRERQKEDDEPEFKFEWQRKYNAPREDYAKGNEDIKDQPFGIPVRNVRCIKCHKWGHINTDKECPLYNQASSSSMPTTSMDPMELMRQMKEDGFGLKENVLGHQLNPAAANQQFIPSDDDESDPEIDFLKSLSSAEKKKLLKKLKKLSKKQEKSSNCKKKKKSKKVKKSKTKASSSDSEKEKKPKKKRSKKSSSSDNESSSDESEKRQSKKNKHLEKTKKKKSSKPSSTDSDSSSDEHEKKQSKKNKHLTKAKKKKSRKSSSTDSSSDEIEKRQSKKNKHSEEEKHLKSEKKKSKEHAHLKDRTFDAESSEHQSRKEYKYRCKENENVHEYASKEDLEHKKVRSDSRKESSDHKIFATKEHEKSTANSRKDSKHLSDEEKYQTSKIKTHDAAPKRKSETKSICEKDINLKKPASEEEILQKDAKSEPRQQNSDYGKCKSKDSRHDVGDSQTEKKAKHVDSEKEALKAKSSCDEAGLKRKLQTSASEDGSKNVNVKKAKYDHPDGFSHLYPQAHIKSNYLQPSEEYEGNVHDDFRHHNRDDRSPSVKQKYNK